MKRLMLSLLIATVCGAVSFPAYSQTYTVGITTNDAWWESVENWGQNVTATIYENGSPISNSSNYYYEWHVFFSREGYWRILTSGNGLNNVVPETYPGNSISVYVIVSDVVNHTFSNIQSPTTAALSMPSQGATAVTFNAYQPGGGTINSYVSPNHWRYTINQWKNGYGGLLTLNYNEVLQATPTYVSAVNDKMDYWNGTTSNILNYNTFYISNGSTLGAYYNSVDGGATITTSVVDAGNVAGGTVSIQDPWLVDNTDSRFYTSPYGYHNLGMSAPFETENAPLQLTTGSKYVGIFLGRNYGGSTPYYSVSAPMVQLINGSTAFFAGWNCSPSNSVSFENAGSITTAIRFNTSGATITAQYKYYTVTYNSTVPAGTWTTAGTVTVPSGITLTASSGGTIILPSSTGLTVNGTLNASGATFTSSSGTWNGITLNANGSSLTNCTISSASCAITFNNVTSATVSGGTINNSNFSSSQAILVNGPSTPTISGVSINGQSGSSNGVRYTSGSGGTLSGCTIQNLGAGNGITIQGNCSALIENNVVQNNYYDGYMITGPTTTNPTLQNNTFNSNGIVGGTRYYNGVVVYNYAGGLITGNTVENSNWGITAYVYSSPTTGGIGQAGSNTVTNNLVGVLAYDNSYPDFGNGDPVHNQYWGVCNDIYGNVTYDVQASSASGVTGRYNWWGQSPPNSGKFYNDGTSYVDYTYYETSEGNCPLKTFKVTGQGPLMSGTVSSVSPTSLMQDVREAIANRDYTGAAALCRLVLTDTTASTYHQEALARLYAVFQASHDTSIIATFSSFSASDNDVAGSATELLAAAYAGSGKLAEARQVAEELVSANPGTETEMKALMLLATLRSFDKSYSSVSKAAFAQLVNKFGTSLGRDWLAGVRTTDDVDLPAAPVSQPQTAGETIDSLGTTLASFPNPFNPSTQIQFTVKQAGFVSLKVYDMLGREVATLVNEVKGPGTYNVNWSANQLATGIYFARFESAGKVAIQKLMYLK